MFAPTARTVRILAALLAAAVLGATAPAAIASDKPTYECNAEKIARFDVEMYVEK